MALTDNNQKSISEKADDPTRVVVPFTNRERSSINNALHNKANLGFSASASAAAASTAAIVGRSDIVAGRITGPVQMLNTIIAAWECTIEDVTNMLGYDPSDTKFVQEILDGVVTLSGRDVKDRVAYLITIYNLLNKLFGMNKVAVTQWLNENQKKLNNTTPYENITSGSMEKLLHTKYIVEIMAGLY